MKVHWKHTERRDGVWVVEFSNAEGEYELTGPYPIQAVGNVQQIDFYFRARGSQWEFETNDEKGRLFPADDRRAFHSRGPVREWDTLTLQTAAEIIAKCVAEFISRVSSSDH